jgi:hypothetical protein
MARSGGNALKAALEPGREVCPLVGLLPHEVSEHMDIFFYMFASAMLSGILVELEQIRRNVQRDA